MAELAGFTDRPNAILWLRAFFGDRMTANHRQDAVGKMSAQDLSTVAKVVARFPEPTRLRSLLTAMKRKVSGMNHLQYARKILAMPSQETNDLIEDELAMCQARLAFAATPASEENAKAGDYFDDLEPKGADVPLAAALTKQIRPFLGPGIVPSPAQQVAMCFAHRRLLAVDNPTSGIIFGDEQGSGKTFSALFTALLHWQKLDPAFTAASSSKGRFSRPTELNPIVIVASVSTVSVWIAEVDNLVLPERFVSIVQSGTSTKDLEQRRTAFKHSAIIVVTKSALTADAYPGGKAREQRDMLTSLNGKCSMVIVDEADQVAADGVRGASSSGGARMAGYKQELVALLELMEGCPRRIMLTGTPWTANSAKGKFCCLIMMCEAYEFFRKCLPHLVRDRSGYYWKLRQTDDNLIEQFMKHNVIRRLLNDIRATSKKGTIDTVDHIFNVPLTQEEHERMTEVETSVSETLSKLIDNASAQEISAALLAQITYLRELCELNASMAFELMQIAATAAAREREKAPPSGVSSHEWRAKEMARVEAAKTRAITTQFAKVSEKMPLSNKELAVVDAINIVSRAGKFGKIVIFTQFVVTNQRVVDLVGKHCKGVRCFHLRSSLKPVDRGNLISQFNSHNGSAVLVLNVKVGQRGINLQAARFVFMLSVDFNPATKEQAEARVKRFSTRFPSVHLCTFLMHSTIQPWIYSRIVADKVQESEALERRKGRTQLIIRMRSTFGTDGALDKDKAKQARQFSTDVLEFSRLREVHGGISDGLANLKPQLEAALAGVVAEKCDSDAEDELDAASGAADSDHEDEEQEEEEEVQEEDGAETGDEEEEMELEDEEEQELLQEKEGQELEDLEEEEEEEDDEEEKQECQNDDEEDTEWQPSSKRVRRSDEDDDEEEDKEEVIQQPPVKRSLFSPESPAPPPSPPAPVSLTFDMNAVKRQSEAERQEALGVLSELRKKWQAARNRILPPGARWPCQWRLVPVFELEVE